MEIKFEGELGIDLFRTITSYQMLNIKGTGPITLKVPKDGKVQNYLSKFTVPLQSSGEVSSEDNMEPTFEGSQLVEWFGRKFEIIEDVTVPAGHVEATFRK
jgi:hypothetical protein